MDIYDVTPAGSEAEFQHWIGQLQMELSWPIRLRPKSEREALAEAQKRMERLRVAMDRARSAGDNWCNYKGAVEDGFLGVREAFITLDLVGEHCVPASC